jgi:hypothetical protein
MVARNVVASSDSDLRLWNQTVMLRKMMQPYLLKKFNSNPISNIYSLTSRESVIQFQFNTITILRNPTCKIESSLFHNNLSISQNSKAIKKKKSWDRTKLTSYRRSWKNKKSNSCWWILIFFLRLFWFKWEESWANILSDDLLSCRYINTYTHNNIIVCF